MVEFRKNIGHQLFADGDAVVDHLGTVLFSRMAAEGSLDVFEALHAARVARHEIRHRRIVEGHHVPEGIGKIVRPPAEFVRIIQAIGQKTGRCGRRTLDRLKGLVVADGVADLRNFAGAEGKRRQGLTGEARAFGRMVGKLAANVVQEAGRLAKGRFLYEMRLHSNVNFGFDQKALSGEAKAALDDFADRLKADDKNVFIEIQGHTDSIGSEAYNLALGKWRADAVKRYLYMNGGVPLNRMSVVSYGEAKPPADNSTAEGRAQNRCVVLVVME